MGRQLLPVAALLAGAAFLFMAGGVHMLLLPVRGGIEGFEPSDIGLIGTGWASGFIAGCLTVPWLVTVRLTLPGVTEMTCTIGGAASSWGTGTGRGLLVTMKYAVSTPTRHTAPGSNRFLFRVMLRPAQALAAWPATT